MIKRIESLMAEQKELSKEVERLKAKMAGGAVEGIMNNKININGFDVICSEVPDADGNALKTMGDQIKSKITDGIIVLISGKGEKVNLVAMATDGAVKAGANAGAIIKKLLQFVAVVAVVVQTWPKPEVKTRLKLQMQLIKLLKLLKLRFNFLPFKSVEIHVSL